MGTGVVGSRCSWRLEAPLTRPDRLSRTNPGPAVQVTLETSASLAADVGRRKLRNAAVVENPDGSLTAMTSYSLVAGLVRVKRVSPRASRVGAKSAKRLARVERSASGRAPSSCGRNSGSCPALSRKRVVAPRGVSVHPWSAEWQVSQVRALVPSG